MLQPSTNAGRDGSPLTPDDEKHRIIAGAVGVSEALLSIVDSGQYLSAEQLLAALADSPDQELTTNALKSSGAGITVHGAESSFSPGEHQRFPSILESNEVFRLRFSDFGEIGQSEVRASFVRLHVAGQSTESCVGELLSARRRVMINVSGSRDAMLFRMGAAAGIELSAKVTASVSTSERTIERFTLVELIEREDALARLTQFMTQLRLPFEDTQITY